MTLPQEIGGAIVAGVPAIATLLRWLGGTKAVPPQVVVNVHIADKRGRRRGE